MQSILKKVSNVLIRKRPLKYLVMRFLKSSRLCILFSIDRDDYRLRFHPSVLSGELWYEPELRIDDEQFFKQYLRPGDSVIDIGANIGGLTLQSSVIVGQAGKVTAIEAHPRIFGYLVKNVDLNRATNVQLFNCALGNADGTVRFADGAMDDTNAIINGEQGLQVPVYRLDSLPIETASIALLKVDVEGFEIFVFEGAERALQATKCVYFESWEENFRRYGYSCKDLIEWLERAGFSIYRLSESNCVERVRQDHSAQICENLIAVRDIADFIERTKFRIRD